MGIGESRRGVGTRAAGLAWSGTTGYLHSARSDAVEPARNDPYAARSPRGVTQCSVNHTAGSNSECEGLEKNMAASHPHDRNDAPHVSQHEHERQGDHAGLEAPLLVSVSEAARLLGIGTTFGWTMVRTGEIPAVKLGCRVLVPRAALERLAGLGGHREIGGSSSDDEAVDMRARRP